MVASCILLLWKKATEVTEARKPRSKEAIEAHRSQKPRIQNNIKKKHTPIPLKNTTPDLFVVCLDKTKSYVSSKAKDAASMRIEGLLRGWQLDCCCEHILKQLNTVSACLVVFTEIVIITVHSMATIVIHPITHHDKPFTIKILIFILLILPASSWDKHLQTTHQKLPALQICAHLGCKASNFFSAGDTTGPRQAALIVAMDSFILLERIENEILPWNMRNLNGGLTKRSPF